MKDKNAPKPALNSYMIFMQLKLNEVKEKKLYPDKPQKDLMAIFGQCSFQILYYNLLYSVVCIYYMSVLLV